MAVSIPFDRYRVVETTRKDEAVQALSSMFVPVRLEVDVRVLQERTVRLERCVLLLDPLTAFAIWMVGMFLLLRNAINDEALEGQPTTAAIQPA